MRLLIPALCAAVLPLAAAAPAGATTFCVPAFHAACPNNGTNVQQANLQTALTTNGSDGIDDRVVIGSHTYTDPDTLNATGTDGIEIIGAGPADTVITSSATTNIYAFDLTGRGTPQRVSDLRIVVPASFPDGPGYGAAAQVREATLQNVQVESRNAGSPGVYFYAGGTLRDCDLFGASGGTFAAAVVTNGVAAGPLTVVDTTIADASIAVRANTPIVPVTMRRVAITGATIGAFASTGGEVDVLDSLITSTGSALALTASGSDSGSVTARNVTLVGLPGVVNPGVSAQVFGGATGSVAMTVSDSIIRGYPQPWSRTAPAGSAGEGNADLTIHHSNVTPMGVSTGDGALTLGAGNIDADPKFAGPSDFRLTAASPSIDAADPAVLIAPDALDLARLPRRVNSTGTAQPIRDQGAYEFQGAATPPAGTPAAPTGGATPGGATPAGTPPASTDATRPRITGLRLAGKVTQRRGGRVRLKLSERARITLTFTRKASRAKPRVVRLTFQGRAGANTLRVAARRLPVGRWALAATAVDPAGNRSAAVRRTVPVAR